MHIRPLTCDVGSLVRAEENAALEEMPLEPVQEALKRSGVVFFDGYAAEVRDFQRFGDRFSRDYMDNTGSGSYRASVDDGGDGTIQNVAYTFGVKTQRTFGLPLHADRSYVKSQPELIWFLCRRPAAEKGLTFVCDGERIYEGLSPRARAVFEQQRLMYIRNYPPAEWPVAFHTPDLEEVKRYCRENDLQLEMRADGSLRTKYLKPAIVPSTRFRDRKAFVNSILIQYWQEEAFKRDNAQVRLEDGSRIPADVIDEVRRVADAITVKLPWSSGDFVIVDNTRMMHGREEFSDPNREIYARMCRSVSW
jgi:alpha-ketoglutarate-dependent taurine dioxygenase